MSWTQNKDIIPDDEKIRKQNEEIAKLFDKEMRFISRTKGIYQKADDCFYCEDGVYHDVLGSPCKYNFCPMCGRKLDGDE